jgi:hypothetical protein
MKLYSRDIEFIESQRDAFGSPTACPKVVDKRFNTSYRKEDINEVIGIRQIFAEAQSPGGGMVYGVVIIIIIIRCRTTGVCLATCHSCFVPNLKIGSMSPLPLIRVPQVGKPSRIRIRNPVRRCMLGFSRNKKSYSISCRLFYLLAPILVRNPT